MENKYSGRLGKLQKMNLWKSIPYAGFIASMSYLIVYWFNSTEFSCYTTQFHAAIVAQNMTNE